ncbi:MAG: DNA topoisomerase IB [Trueperaceae bacterium]|nr:DNA topoisomerase IB [Trueperaceae bacterium]
MSSLLLHRDEAQKAAEAAKLRYTSDDEAGYRRKVWGRGFSYQDADGETIKDERLKARFEALVIPPNWQDVWICKYKNGHLQATGRDEKGRKQYLYHENWLKVRDEAKFSALLPFGENLPALRQQLEIDLKEPCLSKDHVTAALVMLLEHTLIRIGNDSYAQQNKTYGLTTLRNKHVTVKGQRLEFNFVGKSGKEHQISLKDPQLARVIKACSELPGYRLFQYLDDGKREIVDSSDVNSYLKEHMGEHFSAKDFRTWAASVRTATLLYQTDTEKTNREKRLVQVVKEVAKELGNTPAVCRSSYIHPLLPELYLEGALGPAIKAVRKGRPRKYLNQEENSFLRLLQTQG